MENKKIVINVHGKVLAEINQQDDKILYKINQDMITQIVLSSKALANEKHNFVIVKLLDIIAKKFFAGYNHEPNYRQFESVETAGYEIDYKYNQLLFLQKLDSVLDLKINKE